MRSKPEVSPAPPSARKGTCAPDLVFTSSSSPNREEEDVNNAQVCPCGKAVESRTHVEERCEKCKEERDVFQEKTREIHE